jgi:hypothetical protein
LAACGGGGGGGAATTVTPPTNNTPTTPTTPTIPTTPSTNANLIGPPGTASLGTNSANLATGTANFRTNSPNNTVFALKLSALQVTTAKVSDANVNTATANFQGYVNVSGSMYPLLDLKVPSIGLDAHGVTGDAVTLTLANGDKINGSFRNMDYTMTGQWAYTASGSSTTIIGAFTTGLQTPAANVPATGTANFIGNGSSPGQPQAGFVAGRMYVPDGNGGITGSPVSGVANLSVNFAGGAVTGTLTGMMTNAGSTSVLPWNTVNLSGSLSGAAVSGTTSTTGAPLGAGALGFSSAAVGTFGGALYGPNANEVGAVWSLAEPTTDGGKAVLGTFMATKQ